MVEKQCARCKANYTASADEPFITCPSCRIPLPQTPRLPRMQTRSNRPDKGSDSPWLENAVRCLEG